MATETSARAEQLQRDGQQESDYQAFSTALSTSARGRTFLAEYARRNRNADTELLLAAIDKLQTLVAAKPTTAEQVRAELYALLSEISAARRELDANILTMKAAQLADLVMLVERRITGIIASIPGEPKPEILSASPDAPEVPSEKAERTYLAVVPEPDQPELPIPSPIATSQPSIALVRTEDVMAQVTFVELLPSQDLDHAVIETPTVEPALATVLKEAPAKTSTIRTTDPLASIMALSEEERLALFT
jgi:hypothetical protein